MMSDRMIIHTVRIYQRSLKRKVNGALESYMYFIYYDLVFGCVSVKNCFRNSVTYGCLIGLLLDCARGKVCVDTAQHRTTHSCVKPGTSAFERS